MEATYSEARTNLSSLWNEVVSCREPLTVRRRGMEDLVILPAAEFRSLQETAYLLRSSNNARRLLEALMSSLAHEGDRVEPQTLREESKLL